MWDIPSDKNANYRVLSGYGMMKGPSLLIGIEYVPVVFAAQHRQWRLFYMSEVFLSETHRQANKG